MRTAGLLPVSPSMLCLGVYLPRGCTWSWGVYLLPGVYLVPGGCTWSQRMYLLELYLVPGDVPAGGEGVPARWYLSRYPPPRTEFLTHASENITLPQTSFAGGKNGMKPRNK